MKNLLISLIIIFKAGVSVGQSENIILSHGFGEINKINYKKLLKSVGKPDTIIDNSYPKGKKKRNFQIDYYDYNMSLTFHSIYNRNKNKIGKLKSIEIGSSCKLLIIELVICEANLVSLNKLFVAAESKRFSDENNLMLDYYTQYGKTKYVIRVKFNETEQLRSIRINLLE